LRLLHLLNIPLISITLLVSKLLTSILVKLLHPSNIFFILVTFDVSKYVKSNVSKLVNPLNNFVESSGATTVLSPHNVNLYVPVPFSSSSIYATVVPLLFPDISQLSIAVSGTILSCFVTILLIFVLYFS